jgi:hypothetical protein
MRIHELIRPGEEARLRHPEVGDVLWTRKAWSATSGAWGLVWVAGRDRGRALIADESVLLDDRWESAPSGPTDGAIHERRENENTAERLGDPAAVTSRDQFERFVTLLRSNALDDPRLWGASAGEFIGHFQQAVLGMPSYPARDRSGIDPDVPSWPLFAWLLKCARSYLDM